MRQQTEGIEVRRCAAVERDDGSMVVELVIPAGSKAAFFGLFADPSAPLLLSRPGEIIDKQDIAPVADKPPTQRIAPVGSDMCKSMGSDVTPQITALMAHPPFQSWVETQCPGTGGDAIAHALDWLKREAKAGAAGFGDKEARANVVAICRRYEAWFIQTRGTGEKPVPW